MNIRCPKCGQPTLFAPENRFRPFCSERCQTLDLGAWADEQYRVPIQDSQTSEPVNENSNPAQDDEESLNFSIDGRILLALQ